MIEKVCQNLLNQTISNEKTSFYPTIYSLALEWYILGEEIQNGVVTVQVALPTRLLRQLYDQYMCDRPTPEIYFILYLL